VKADVKKAVDANQEFLSTVFKAHILAFACNVLEISSPDGNVQLPPHLIHASTSASRQFQFVEHIASRIVDECTLLNICNENVMTRYTIMIKCVVITVLLSLSLEMLGQRVMVSVSFDVGD